MTVQAILAEKGNNVVTVGQNASLQEVASTLAEHKIGAAVVLNDDGDVCGIASERDLIRRVADTGDKALHEPVMKCMTRSVISATQAESVDMLMEKMTRGRFRHVPVIEDGKLIGIISIGDVVKRKIEQAEHDVEDMKRYIAG